MTKSIIELPQPIADCPAPILANPVLNAVPGLAIKMQPFIDSDAWVFGVVESVDEDWIYVKWQDKADVLQHYHSEVEGWVRHCI